jgi:hypothetical protein
VNDVGDNERDGQRIVQRPKQFVDKALFSNLYP